MEKSARVQMHTWAASRRTVFSLLLPSPETLQKSFCIKSHKIINMALRCLIKVITGLLLSQQNLGSLHALNTRGPQQSTWRLNSFYIYSPMLSSEIQRNKRA